MTIRPAIRPVDDAPASDGPARGTLAPDALVPDRVAGAGAHVVTSASSPSVQAAVPPTRRRARRARPGRPRTGRRRRSPQHLAVPATTVRRGARDTGSPRGARAGAAPARHASNADTRRRRRTRRRGTALRLRSASVHAVLALVGLSVGLGTGAASAFWLAGGTGQARADAGTGAPLTTVTASASTSSLLYPNGPAADVTLTVRNPNVYPVRVTSVLGAGTVTASGGIGSCVTTGVALVAPAAGVPFVVPARTGQSDGAVTVVLTGAAQMTDASENGCQGAVFTVPVALSGESA